MDNTEKALNEILASSTDSFLKENGIDLSAIEANVTATQETLSSQPLLFSLPYAGENMSGGFYLTCNYDFLKKTHPLREMNPDIGEGELKDWGGEICNQLLGRVKNTLLHSGVDFILSVPNVVTGNDFKIESSSNPTITAVCATELNTFFSLSYTLKEPVEIDPLAGEREESISEGDALFF